MQATTELDFVYTVTVSLRTRTWVLASECILFADVPFPETFLDLVPVANGRALFASIDAAIVDARRLLAINCITSGTKSAPSFEVVSHAFLGATFIVATL